MNTVGLLILALFAITGLRALYAWHKKHIDLTISQAKELEFNRAYERGFKQMDKHLAAGTDPSILDVVVEHYADKVPDGYDEGCRDRLLREGVSHEKVPTPNTPLIRAARTDGQGAYAM